MSNPHRSVTQLVAGRMQSEAAEKKKSKFKLFLCRLGRHETQLVEFSCGYGETACLTCGEYPGEKRERKKEAKRAAARAALKEGKRPFLCRVGLHKRQWTTHLSYPASAQQWSCLRCPRGG